MLNLHYKWNYSFKLWVVMIVWLSFSMYAEDTKKAADAENEKESKAEVSTGQTVKLKNWRQIAPGLTVGGSLRSRGEMKNDFNFNASQQDYLLTQLRLNLTWKPGEQVTVFVEGQDARIFDENIAAAPSINREATPNIFADDFDLHQGYVDVKFNSGKTPVKLRAGRQKFNLGAMRLVASLEWVNTARVWDGVRLTVGDTKKRNLDLFASRVVPVNPNSLNGHAVTGSRYFNSGFHGVYYTDKQIVSNGQVEGYWLWRKVSNVNDNVHTVGARYAGKSASVDVNGEIAGQFGTFGGVNHRAAMLHAGAGYTAKTLNNSRVGAAYNYGSGDNNPADNTHNTFDNLYPLNHAYYGFMDFFSLQNIHNAELTIKSTLAKTAALRVGYQNFWLANASNDAWYNAGVRPVRNANGAAVSSHVGSEVDITFKAPVFNKKLVLVGGYSHFFAGSYMKNTGANGNASFLFLQTKVKL